MRALWILSALCATSLTAAFAQDPVTTRERIEREVAEKQRLMREGKVVRSNVRVTVRLTNGSRMRGVVKNGRFIERHDGLSFVPSDRVADDSGLRIWYYDQTNSFVFLPWSTISEHSIGEILTDEQVAQMGLELDRKAREARERVAGSQPAKPDPKPDPKAGEAGAGGATGPAAPAVPESPLTADEKALLAEFPPKEGWSLARLQEIELRKVQVHVYPNEKEQRFLDNFAAWNAAKEKQDAYEAELAAAEAARRAAGRIPTGTSGTPATPPKGGGDPKPSR